MRKFILIATMTLLPAAAMAGQSRSLSLASTEPSTQAATEQSKADTPAAAISKEPAKTPNMADKPADSAKVKKRHVSTEARIIDELHRHGIHW